jgi:PAS domain S-box-containing protein
LLDEETNELVLLASKNIHKNVTNRFKRISSSSTMSCGHALLLKKRTFIDYANPDAPDLDGALKAHVDAGLLSAQSTPLITREGKLIGMVTTHWKQRHFKPTERQLQYLDLLARQAADLLERKQHSEKYLLQLENDVRLRTAEIDKQKQLFEAVINSTPDLVGAYDTEKRILIFNKSCEKLFNTKCEEVIGKKYHEVFPQGKNTQADRDLDRVLQGETVHNKLFHSIVSGRDYENYLVPLRDENGKVYAAVTIAQDITEKNLRAKELEATNNELQKMNKELEAFTYASSHDLQEPLRKIRIFAGRIMDADQDKLSEKSKGYFVYIQEAVERMQTLISDLLSFSHLASTERKYEMTDLGSIIREIKKEFKETIEAKNAIIETQNLCRVNVIRFQFRQLLHNLVSNALKFTKPGTPPHIIIRCKKTKLLPSPPFTGQEGVIISISDNGIGFEPHYSERVFEMFQKLHSKDEDAGTGLGLAIVKKIVENHHGCITVDSQPDKGTTFNVYLAG